MGARVRAAVRRRVPVDPLASAQLVGLRYVNDASAPGIRRIGPSKHPRYINPSNKAVTNREVLGRIRALAIPPAWTDVWICVNPNGHLQTTGRDARGRKQYRYHARWREVRDEVKYARLIPFARALARIRKRTAADVKRSGLSRETVLGAVVQLLEKTLIRVGNEEYARDNGSVGLTTMRDAHATITGPKVRFEFRGKSGIRHAIDLNDPRLAKIVKACRELPGYELFQYVDDEGKRQTIDSADVNAYLREVSGEAFTAKDFRTWVGTLLAARALNDAPRFSSTTEANRHVGRAVESVAGRLGNTKTVCRKCYIHPAVLDAYMHGATIRTVRKRAPAIRGLEDEEAAVVALLERAARLYSLPGDGRRRGG
jgi:DNA topoisomerase-1